MALRVNREILSEVLTAAQTCVETKNTIPALAFAALEMKDGKLTITSTDLDVTYQTTIEAEGDNGAFCVPVRDVARLVGLFEGDTVSLAPDDARVTIACGKSKYKLPMLAREAFPNPEEVHGKQFLIKGSILKVILERTVFCVSTEPGKYNTAGVLLEVKDSKLHSVATDGYRAGLVKYSIPCSEQVSAVVPPKAIRAVIKNLNDGNDDPVSVVIGEQGAKFIVGETAIRARLLDGHFPKYEMIFPSGRKHTVAVSSDALKIFKRAAITGEIISASNAPAVILSISKDSIEFSSSHSESGEGSEFMAAKCDTLNGESVPIKFASRYLSEMLAYEPEVSLMFDDNNNSLLVTPNGLREYEYQYVMMPCRI